MFRALRVDWEQLFEIGFIHCAFDSSLFYPTTLGPTPQKLKTETSTEGSIFLQRPQRRRELSSDRCSSDSLSQLGAGTGPTDDTLVPWRGEDNCSVQRRRRQRSVRIDLHSGNFEMPTRTYVFAVQILAYLPTWSRLGITALKLPLFRTASWPFPKILNNVQLAISHSRDNILSCCSYSPLTLATADPAEPPPSRRRFRLINLRRKKQLGYNNSMLLWGPKSKRSRCRRWGRTRRPRRSSRAAPTLERINWREEAQPSWVSRMVTILSFSQGLNDFKKVGHTIHPVMRLMEWNRQAIL